MGQGKGTKRKATAANKGIQQQISTMFGEKIKKPRMYMGSAAPTKPNEKPGTLQIPSKTDNGSPSSMTDPVASQKRRWRLSELVKKERENRLKTSNTIPSFVFEAPHMDTRRPRHRRDFDASSKLQQKSNGPSQKKARVSPTSVKYGMTNNGPTPTKTQGPLGGEALLYDRTMLPNSHALLLDVLHGLESAVSLLRTRKTIPTVAGVREIVSRSTRRTFTLRILSQLAHIVPEAIAVLPGNITVSKLKRPSDNLIIRLDDIDSKLEKGLDAPQEKTSSTLGDSPARMRRSLLHKRLLSHVREHHERFLRMSKVARYIGNMWHPEFNLEKEVPELPAPPLYPMRLGPVQDKRVETPKENSMKVNEGNADKKVDESTEESTEDKVGEDHLDVGISRSLLERVRARERERSRISSATEIERTTNRSLLTKLPCTMDTILSILRGERRSAIGWLQLLTRLEKLHPNKWPREDLEAQLTVITDLASNWCKKVELKSSRGGYAFRVIAPSQFASARDKVSATKCYPAKED